MKEVREGTKGMLMTEYRHERVTSRREVWRVRFVRAYEARTSCNVPSLRLALSGRPYFSVGFLPTSRRALVADAISHPPAAATAASYPPCPNIAAVYRNFTLRECTSRPLRARFVDDEACPETSRSTRDFATPRRPYHNFRNYTAF
ncbi:hypothetical protein PUN28_018041 [Cardiocondyla obscurior]|uniref:Uncharacterized protein n=1 Tax=Cardiocondyla obscurior TaxID=286306 RepID=A0AAW2EJF6_9HYME